MRCLCLFVLGSQIIAEGDVSMEMLWTIHDDQQLLAEPVIPFLRLALMRTSAVTDCIELNGLKRLAVGRKANHHLLTPLSVKRSFIHGRQIELNQFRDVTSETIALFAFRI